MAMTVPTVDGPSVAPQSVPSAYQRSSISPGMLHNRQLGDAGRVLEEVGGQMQDRQDTDELMRAETLVKGDYLQWEGEAKQRKGQQAWGVTKEAGEWWDKNASKVAEGISSPRAKAQFQREVAKHRAMAVGSFSGYEVGQRRASLEASATASIVGSINQAAANPQDATIMGVAREDIIKRNQMLAQLNGWPPEQAEAQLSTYLTNLHKQVIQGLATSDHADQAEVYFKEHQGEIEGSQRAEVGHFAAVATANKVGEQQADQVWNTMGPKGDRDPVQVDKMLQAVRESSLGEEAKKAASASIKERSAAFKDSRRERDEGLEANVNKAIMAGAGGAQIRRMPEFLSMDGEKQRRLIDFMEGRSLREEQRQAARESRSASEEVRAQASLARHGMGDYLRYSNPDTLAGMTENQIINLLPSLGNELTNHLMQQKRTLAKPGKLGEARMDTDDFNQVAQEMGLKPFATSKTEDEKAGLGGLKYRVEQMISAVESKTGKTLPREEKLNMMRSEMARTVTVDRPWWSGGDITTPVIQLTKEQIDKVVVPPADAQRLQTKMNQMYKRTGAAEYEPTPQNLRRFYLMDRSKAAAKVVLPKDY